GMKLARFGDPGKERAAVLLDDGARVDASAVVRESDVSFCGGAGLRALGAWLTDGGVSAPRLDPAARIAAPFARPSKIVCIGLNFPDHAAESQTHLPKEPARV